MSWESLERTAKKGPIALGCSLIVILTVLTVAVGLIGYGCGWFSEAGQVAQEEFGPRALLEKYEWFKDTLATLESKLANIQIVSQRLTQFESDFEDISRPDWDRFARQEYQQLQSELAGIVMSYNNLADNYNANMAKFNYQFCNVGTLPAGATDPLPRNVVPYVSGY